MFLYIALFMYLLAWILDDAEKVRKCKMVGHGFMTGWVVVMLMIVMSLL